MLPWEQCTYTFSSPMQCSQSYRHSPMGSLMTLENYHSVIAYFKASCYIETIKAFFTFQVASVTGLVFKNMPRYFRHGLQLKEALYFGAHALPSHVPVYFAALHRTCETKYHVKQADMLSVIVHILSHNHCLSFHIIIKYHIISARTARPNQ